MRALERRHELLQVLCTRRYDKICNLAHEFGVSERTIMRDVQELSLTYPIYTKQGTDGGVYVERGYYINKSYLKENEVKLLNSLKQTLSVEEKVVLEGIIARFSRK